MPYCDSNAMIKETLGGEKNYKTQQKTQQRTSWIFEVGESKRHEVTICLFCSSTAKWKTSEVLEMANVLHRPSFKLESMADSSEAGCTPNPSDEWTKKKIPLKTSEFAVPGIPADSLARTTIQTFGPLSRTLHKRLWQLLFFGYLKIHTVRQFLILLSLSVSQVKELIWTGDVCSDTRKLAWAVSAEDVSYCHEEAN